MHAFWSELHAAYSANVNQVNNAKIQTDVSSKQLYVLDMFYLGMFLYLFVELDTWVFVHQDAYMILLLPNDSLKKYRHHKAKQI